MIRTSPLWSWVSPILLASLACSSSNATPPGNGGISDGGAMNTAGSSSSSAGAANSPSASAGSGNNLNVDSDAGMDAGDVKNGECAHEAFELSRQPAEILIVLDRSGSMKEIPSGSTGTTTKWDLVVPGVNEVVTATDASVSWGLKVFPEGEGRSCSAGTVTDAIPVAIAATNAAAVTSQITGTTPEGNGTPTGDAINAAVTYLKTLTSQNPKIILLATDGEPSCAGTSGNSTESRAFAVKAITDAAAAGFKTVVVGVATTKDSATTVLNDMAVAGQMPRVDSDPAATKFHLASTKDELVKSLQEITGKVSSCVFDLKSTPPDPDNIAVQINGQKAPKDTTHMNGWDYTSADNRRVEVYGQWCEQLKTPDAKKVNFVLGCPGEVIP
ncbi:MAG TPA: vWA domain-containing protein [Polyangiaceae bacterium]|nr:vWA domain-containing protein [Polyangiaceae bacterium]